jgi:hypothetical protein
MEFQNGKIYTIRSHQTNKYYIGSTNQKTLSQRLGKHRSCYNIYLNNNTRGYISSFEILQYTDHYIELLELYPCNTKAELHRKEGELIREFKSDVVNIQIAGRTQAEYIVDNVEHITEYYKQYNINNAVQKKEYNKQYQADNKTDITEHKKQYYNDNKQVIAEQYKQYYNDNKHVILEQRKQPIICECGLTLTKCNKAQHMRTTKHIKLLHIKQLFNNELNHYNF